jgi:hypothetical protein
MVWLPLLRFFQEGAPPAQTAAVMAKQERRTILNASVRTRESLHLRTGNPEWDLMRRMFLALSFADIALTKPEAERSDAIAVLDRIVDDLLSTLEHEGEPYTFLLPYAQQAPWKTKAGRSLFVDGEVALVLATRRYLGGRPELEAPLQERILAIEQSMGESPSVSGESYPNEAWTFCNTTALAALRIADVVHHTDHGPLAKQWIDYAKAHLIEESSGLLASRYRYDGSMRGPKVHQSLWSRIT